MSTGYFSLCLGGVGKGQKYLHFEPVYLQLAITTESRVEIRQEKWNGEEIRDFVRKLGFVVDKDKGKCLLNLDQVSPLVLSLKFFPSIHASFLCMIIRLCQRF